MTTITLDDLSVERNQRVWARIRAHAGAEFRTVTGVVFTYEIPGDYLRVKGINRSLSHTNFAKAIDLMPVDGPGSLPGVQGASYTWGILMDPRIRETDW